MMLAVRITGPAGTATDGSDTSIPGADCTGGAPAGAAPSRRAEVCAAALVATSSAMTIAAPSDCTSLEAPSHAHEEVRRLLRVRHRLRHVQPDQSGIEPDPDVGLERRERWQVAFRVLRLSRARAHQPPAPGIREHDPLLAMAPPATAPRIVEAEVLEQRHPEVATIF